VIRAHHPRRSLASFFALSPSSAIPLSLLESALADKHRVLSVFSRNRPPSSPLDATFTRMLLSVDFKEVTFRDKPFRCNTYTKTGEGLHGHTTLPVRCFDLSSLFATHFGTRARKDHSRVLPALTFQSHIPPRAGLSIVDPTSVRTVDPRSRFGEDYGQNLQSSVGTSFRSCRRRCR